MGIEDRGGLPAARARIEANVLGENPVFALWSGTNHQAGSARKLQRAEWSWEHECEGGAREVRAVEVESTRGLPSAIDMDVLVALLAIRERNRDAERIYFTRREIGELLGWGGNSCTWGGRSDRLVRESLERLQVATLWFKNSWRDKAGWTTIKEGLHVLDGLKLFDRAEHGYGRRKMSRRDYNWARLSERILKSIVAGHFAYVDLETYRRLPAGLPRRLYLYLAWKRGRGGSFQIDLHRLARHMPLTCQNVTLLLRSVTRAAAALARTPGGRPFLARPLEVERRNRSQFLLRFEISPRRPRTIIVSPAEALDRNMARFYEAVGVEPTRERIAQDVRVVTSLREQGFTDEELKYAVSYMLSRPKEWKNPRSLGLLPHVMPHAIKDKKRREEEERQRQAQSIKRDAERLKAERDRLYADRARELARRKIAELSAERLADLRREAAELPIVKGMPRQLRDGELAYQVERLVLERCCSPEELAACEPQLARPD